MNLHLHRAFRRQAVALVITLLMLSVITFLTIAFLAMSQRNRSAVSASLDQATARAMSDAALARAQAEIIGRMVAHGDPLYYDYMVSTAYQSPSNFDAGETGYDANNVNYDSFFTNGTGITAANYAAGYAQNCANLWYDPRPPVFVVTNQAKPTNYDFRFWVDVNRNGRYETNGLVTNIVNELGQTDGEVFENGEPEFIGILRNPLYAHSSSNLFIGRYAYLVLPIGKELDFNYIHNFLKATYGNVGLNNVLGNASPGNDGFARDQGVGSWELNLAGTLDAVSPWAYESTITNYPRHPYNYIPPQSASYNSLANYGYAFDDAEAILHYRYPPVSPLTTDFLLPLAAFYSNYFDFTTNQIDMYCELQPTNGSFDYAGPNSVQFQVPGKTWPWPGSYQTNLFFDVQDLFDPNKTSSGFVRRMELAAQRTNTFDRYTFQRLISSVGMGSSPEYGVWVHGDNGQPVLRTKININWDNTSQMHSPNAPYALMPTNLVPWTPLGFFTNAAELLLRSQTFMFSNYVVLSNGTVAIGIPIVAHFGMTNIPIYMTNVPGIRYDESVHRMLQLAANIYDATVTNNYQPPVSGFASVRHPSVFKPLFGLVRSNNLPVGIDIIGYTQMTNPAVTVSNVQQFFYDPHDALTNLAQTGNSNINIAGIPWVVGANKGLPQFYEYSYQNSVLYERKLGFVRYPGPNNQPATNLPPQFTNQFYCMWVSNSFGLDAWNPYTSNFLGSNMNGTTCFISNYVTVQLTNNYNYGPIVAVTNFLVTNIAYWPGLGFRGSNGFITLLNTNATTLPPSYFSPSYNAFYPLGYSNLNSTNGNMWLPRDTNQTAWPTYNWTLNISNHLVYALFDGPPNNPGALLDFVNLGPFGTSTNIQQLVSQNASGNGLGGINGGNNGNPWALGNATSLPGSVLSLGALNQIGTAESTNTAFANSLKPPNTGQTANYSGSYFGCPDIPAANPFQTVPFVANDPLVHYTVDDLTRPALASVAVLPVSAAAPFPLLNNSNLGVVNTSCYSPWIANGQSSPAVVGNNMLFKDPLIYAATNWNFPTNKFPGVGWLGRVHRGTPWQTVYLKADNPTGSPASTSLALIWTNWVTSPWFPPPTVYPTSYYMLIGGSNIIVAGAPPYEPMPESYPTNDWSLVDLFTTAPNDNAARGLLSVNQTNDAAWAAVFAGAIAPLATPNYQYTGVPIMPLNGVYTINGVPTTIGVSNLVDYNPASGVTNTINAMRTYYPNGIFHKVGDILGAAALTTESPFLGGSALSAQNYSDEIVERIPQQTLSLLKVGEPQFAIYAYGQSLKPKGPPYLNPGGLNNGIYTNYEITGEWVSRTVCHLVYTNSNNPKMVIDNYNVESGSGN